MQVRTFVTIYGEIHGAIWMPDRHCSRPVRERFEIKHGAESLPANSGLAFSVRDAVIRPLMDGDFQSARYTPETEVAVEREWWLPSARVVRCGPGNSYDQLTGQFHVRRRRVVVLGGEYVEECDGHDYGDDGDDMEEEQS